MEQCVVYDARLLETMMPKLICFLSALRSYSTFWKKGDWGESEHTFLSKSHKLRQGGQINSFHSSSSSFSFVLSLLLICIWFTLSLFVALFCIVLLFIAPITTPFPLSPCHLSVSTFVPYIPLSLFAFFLSVSLLQVFDSHTAVIWLLFYFNLTLLFRNTHPHALAILLAPFRSLFTHFFSPPLGCSNFWLHFSLLCSWCSSSFPYSITILSIYLSEIVLFYQN